MSIKPILFNTEMVRAILNGKKTQTRRLVKNLPFEDPCATVFSPINSGDTLWVRETWMEEYEYDGLSDRTMYIYKASDPERKGCWHPSIHMPREAARIFLRVTDVRLELLQDITEDDVCAEGAEKIITRCLYMDYSVNPPEPCYNVRPCKNCIRDRGYPELFGEMIWNPTIKKADLPRYGWEANPWVWVITFERIKKPEGWPNV